MIEIKDLVDSLDPGYHGYGNVDKLREEFRKNYPIKKDLDIADLVEQRREDFIAKNIAPQEDNWLGEDLQDIMYPDIKETWEEWEMPPLGAVKEDVGIKLDSNKPPMDLIDPDFLIGLANVLGFGAKKYDRWNWKKGIALSRLISAAYRHLTSINNNEDLDKETGLQHAFHLAACAMFLAHTIKNRKDLDDRWKQ